MSLQTSLFGSPSRSKPLQHYLPRKDALPPPEIPPLVYYSLSLSQIGYSRP